MTRTFFVVFFILAAIILGIGVTLSLNGRASLIGVIVVGVVFVLVPFFVAMSNSKIERKAERVLAADGQTQFVVGQTALTVGDAVVPYERITFMYASAEGEVYSNGGIRGEAMAYRMDLSSERPTVGRAVGARIGTAQRKKLYRDGAKSAISLAIGVDQKSTIVAPEAFVNHSRHCRNEATTLDRIDVPFGAYHGAGELEALLGAVYQATGGRAFPIAIIAGTLNWASANDGSE